MFLSLEWATGINCSGEGSERGHGPCWNCTRGWCDLFISDLTVSHNEPNYIYYISLLYSLRLNVYDAKLQNCFCIQADFGRHLPAFDVEATKVESAFNQLYSFIFDMDVGAGSAATADKPIPSAIFVVNFDKVWFAVKSFTCSCFVFYFILFRRFFCILGFIPLILLFVLEVAFFSCHVLLSFGNCFFNCPFLFVTHYSGKNGSSKYRD